MTLTDDQFDKLKREYATLMMDSMDYKDMEEFIFNTIYDNLEMAREDEMIEEIKEFHGNDECNNLLNNL